MTQQPSYAFEAIGTHWVIETATVLSDAQKTVIAATIGSFDQTYSRFRADSLVRKLAQHSNQTIQFPDSVARLYTLYKTLFEVTDGKINPLVGHSLEQLGYDAAYSFIAKTPAIPPHFTHSITMEQNTLTTRSPVLLDIGAIGKGYIVDEIARYLATITSSYAIDAGGDIAVSTPEPQIIGLEHPMDASMAIGTIRLVQGSICGSATNRRAWGSELHHIIDATTGLPYDGDIVATWAIADSTTIADALTSGLFFASPNILAKHFGNFTYVIMRRNGTVTHNITPAVGELFI